ncbi:MAG: YtxH domain-containing protein [Chloroflexi bacterium]|nr:YtxH domain-containing protein [Chloroflexota bacterium]
MSDRNGSDLGNFLSGFLVGGLIGSAVALLMAPQSGEETRAMLKEKGGELKDKTTESLEAAYAHAEAAAGEARSRADELAQMARQRAEELRERGQVVLEEQRSRVENVIEAAKAPPKTKKANSSGKSDSKKS